jgi:hypothetical protein
MRTAKRILAISAAAVAFAASARTVYDAGRALRQNCESGSYANPYTDANGGVWSYYYASSLLPFSGTAFESTSTITSDKLAGWKNWDHQHLKVNVTGQILDDPSLIEAGEPLEVDEMYFHPERNLYTVLRFTVPEDGWYSAFASFHDVNQEAAPQATSGVDVHVTLGSESAGDTNLVSALVALENYPAGWGDANRTQRFDYQMPVRYLTQGMRLQFAVGPHGTDWAIPNDGTGVKVLVVKEDEGRFYDSGIAFTTNVVGGYVNPYGTAQHGTWHALLLNLGTSAVATDFQSWIPQNLENSLVHGFTQQCTFNDSLTGFNTTDAGNEPYVTVNMADGPVKNVSSRELYVHPPSHANNQCTVVRFRPPEAARYSASVVARYLENGANDGVEVFLVVADKIVTNSIVSGEGHVKSTMHLTFDNLLLAAAEPVDIIVSPRSAYWSDGVAVSAIFRREDGAVYDANKSFYAHHEAGNTTVPFSDVLGDGAQWSLGTMTGSWLPDSFATLSGFVNRQNSNPAGLSWWEHSPDNSGSRYPRIAMTTNAVASCDNTYFITPYPRLAITPNEVYAHPNSPGQSTSCVAVRAIVPSNGVYRVRGRARDLDNTGTTGGIRFTLAVAGYIPATSLVQMDPTVPSGVSCEASLEGDRLWLKAGETFDAVVDPEIQYYCDSTGIGLCYERAGDGTAGVVNVDFTGTGTGKLSANAIRAREGFGDWLSWNALRPGGEALASVANCLEANGTTKRNMAVSLTRESGAAIATGTAASGTALLDAFVSSSGTDDAYTFTISALKANEPYTLWLYSANGRASGNAAFTVGGVTKGVEEIWSLGATKMLTRFDVVSDANGEISGTFAAADANGGVFNGITLVGDLPDYKSQATVITIR